MEWSCGHHLTVVVQSQVLGQSTCYMKPDGILSYWQFWPQSDSQWRDQFYYDSLVLRVAFYDFSSWLFQPKYVCACDSEWGRLQGLSWVRHLLVMHLKQWFSQRVEWHDWSLYVHFMIAVKIFYCYSVHSPSSHTYHFRMQGFQSYSMMRSGWLLPRWINRSRKMEGIWAPLATRSNLQQRMSKTRQDCNISINNINCLVHPCLALSPGSSQLLTVTLKAGRSLGMRPTHI